MDRIGKRLALILILIVSISGLIIWFSMPSALAQSGASKGGIIGSDATWTRANSPYSLTGNVLIENGATLTIEPGVTINLGVYSIQINGTLTAKGNSTDRIYFNSEKTYHDIAINFLSFSTSWNEQTGFGSIIQNTVFNAQSAAICIQNVAPIIDSNSITGTYIVISDGLPIISNNDLNGEIHVTAGSPTIKDNQIKGLIASTGKGTTIISNNTIVGNFGDTVEGAGISCGNAIITDNVIAQFQKGILIIQGVSTIERNVVVSNLIGIQVGEQHVGYSGGLFQITIEDNLITNNSKGISVLDLPPSIQTANFSIAITKNNIQNNTENNFYLGAAVPITATNNWWGTSDPQAINQTIYDFKNDFNSGNVSFTPFLILPNPITPNYIVASAGTGGSIYPIGYVKVDIGGSRTFTITPNDGYTIDDISVNGTSVGVFKIYEVQNIGGSTTIFVKFSAKSSTLEFLQLVVLLVLIIVIVTVAILLLFRRNRKTTNLK
jgi:hypothetical protein